MSDESATWDAVETMEQLRSGAVSRQEVLEAAIARAEAAAPLGAVATPTYELARAATPSGPLAGVPTFIKDLAQVEGVRTTWGSRATGVHVSRRTDPSLVRLLRTGLVSLGKSATPEFGLTATTEPLGGPPCRNPWDPTRSSGGSSGGAGCLVAAGVVPIAHGSDGGGSLRIPAACNGLVALKPTRGRFDVDGSRFLAVNTAVHGVLTRTVRDQVAFYAALESRGSPITPIGEVRAGAERGLRIGLFVDSPIGTPVDGSHRAAAERAGQLCASLGHQVEAIACPFETQVTWDFFRFWAHLGFLYTKAGKYLTGALFDASRLEPWTQAIGRYFAGDLRASLEAIWRLRRFTTTYERVMERYDVLLCPTTAEPPPLLGRLAPDQPFDVLLERLIRFVPFTPIQNASGAPAISLPLGRTPGGLPIGVQLAGARGSEGRLLSLALALEEAAPWPRSAGPEHWRPLLGAPASVGGSPENTRPARVPRTV